MLNYLQKGGLFAALISVLASCSALSPQAQKPAAKVEQLASSASIQFIDGKTEVISNTSAMHLQGSGSRKTLVIEAKGYERLIPVEIVKTIAAGSRDVPLTDIPLQNPRFAADTVCELSTRGKQCDPGPCPDCVGTYAQPGGPLACAVGASCYADPETGVGSGIGVWYGLDPDGFGYTCQIDLTDLGSLPSCVIGAVGGSTDGDKNVLLSFNYFKHIHRHVMQCDTQSIAGGKTQLAFSEGHDAHGSIFFVPYIVPPSQQFKVTNLADVSYDPTTTFHSDFWITNLPARWRTYKSGSCFNTSPPGQLDA